MRNHRPCVFVDVDRTLIDDKGKALPLVDVVRAQCEAGRADVVVWSARGRAYAMQQVGRLGLNPTAVVGKPTCMYDDQGAGWLKYCKVVRPPIGGGA
jgi:predicted mannosyl-3-phosphoglycerate phosphatase (HAD superfamily)